MCKLTQKFNNMINIAANLKNSGIDGLDFWRKVKPDFAKYDNRSTEMKYTINKAYIHKINYLFHSKQLQNKDKNGETIIPDHFIYQLVNLPVNETVCIRRVMQLALNIGQWKSANKNTAALIEANKIFNDYNLDNIKSYLAKEDIETLSNLLV